MRERFNLKDILLALLGIGTAIAITPDKLLCDKGLVAPEGHTQPAPSLDTSDTPNSESTSSTKGDIHIGTHNVRARRTDCESHVSISDWISTGTSFVRIAGFDLGGADPSISSFTISFSADP